MEFRFKVYSLVIWALAPQKRQTMGFRHPHDLRLCVVPRARCGLSGSLSVVSQESCDFSESDFVAEFGTS